ncbi:MAG TPA: ABC transporter ATP-binding protein [Anaerolineae bacterium]|nr:ABC transporter ATP-binding protein [Anaerolineae bacterium]
MSMFAGLDAEAYDREYSDRVLIRRIALYFAAYRGKVASISLLVTAMAIFGAALPIVIARGVDALEEQLSDLLVVALPAFVALVGVLNWAANWARRRLTQRVTGDVMLSLRRDAFRASVQHDLSFYDEFKTGRIVSRITSDTQEFAQVVVLVTDLISQVLVVLILLPILFSIEWRLTLLLLATTPVVYVAAAGFRKLARHVTRQGSRAMAEVNAAIQEAVTGIHIAKNFRQEQAIYESFNRVNALSYRINLRRGMVLATIFPVLNALGGVGTALLVYFGGQAAVAGAITAGAWFLFVTSVERFWFPMINIAAFWSQFQGGLSAAERIFALIDAEPAVRQTGGRPAPRLRGAIRFDHVDFRYSKQETVLESFSLRIAAGENVALVGHTGAGKSSIAKLIARFYEFQSGRLTIDGHDIRSFDLQSYRRQLGIVSQTPFLFSGTVADNIRYGSLELSDGDIEAIARRIGGGEWLDSLPDGLRADVGERGDRLSMGQRQLVALTRVLAQQPAIFILDEATASVDPFTESQIREALDLILAGCTSILIAHRLSTVKSADRIIVLREGEIIEEGNHAALMAQGGHYAELYDTYFRHQSLEYILSGPKQRAPAFAREARAAVVGNQDFGSL